jgi:hypothetical protein
MPLTLVKVGCSLFPTPERKRIHQEPKEYHTNYTGHVLMATHSDGSFAWHSVGPGIAAMLIVDTHPHVMTAASGPYPHQPVGGQQSGWSRDIELDGAAFAAMMSAAGAAKAALVQTSTAQDVYFRP